MSRGRGIASGVLRSSPKPEKRSPFCIRRGIEIFFVCFLHTDGQNVFFYQTAGRRPPHLTGRRVDTVILGWVGGPNERAPFRFMTKSLVLSTDVCSGLAISPLRVKQFAELSQAYLGSTNAREMRMGSETGEKMIYTYCDK